MSACSCDFDYVAEYQEKKIREARKHHKCTDCGKEIKPGEFYEVTAHLFDDGWLHGKSCPVCANVRERFGNCIWYGGGKPVVDYLLEFADYEVAENHGWPFVAFLKQAYGLWEDYGYG